MGGTFGEPMYVTRIESVSGQVFVGKESELMKKSFRVKDVNWISIPRLKKTERFKTKIRHQSPMTWAAVAPAREQNVFNVEFDFPQRAVTPGQAAVFYKDDLVVGGGWIE